MIQQDFEKEIWKDINGYKDIYQISNFGRVKSLKRKTKNGSCYEDKILKNNINNCGYKYIVLRKQNIKKTFTIHRLVAINFIENLLNKPNVNHKDGIKINNNIDNLEWCTQEENIIHASNNNISHKGEKNGNAKLNNQAIKVIKYYLKKRITMVKLAKIYKINHKTIQNIKYNYQWKHIILEKELG